MQFKEKSVLSKKIAKPKKLFSLIPIIKNGIPQPDRKGYKTLTKLTLTTFINLKEQ